LGSLYLVSFVTLILIIMGTLNEGTHIVLFLAGGAVGLVAWAISWLILVFIIYKLLIWATRDE
jgi:hypothetical protein